MANSIIWFAGEWLPFVLIFAALFFFIRFWGKRQQTQIGAYRSLQESQLLEMRKIGQTIERIAVAVENLKRPD